jgi:hypothetical protein
MSKRIDCLSREKCSMDCPCAHMLALDKVREAMTPDTDVVEERDRLLARLHAAEAVCEAARLYDAICHAPQRVNAHDHARAVQGALDRLRTALDAWEATSDE